MKPTRIAMWSGPRNISTAMMRSWENREDTIVIDEPLYGPYLSETKKQHPMFSEIIKGQGKDEEPIINELTSSELPRNKSIYYQKHMCHHILEGMDISWVMQLENVFLIRDPRYVLSSYLRKHDNPTPEDLGYPQQFKLFNFVKQQCGYTPVVMDSKDILLDPEGMLGLLCKELNVKFDSNMMLWPKGYRKSDGVWASHWYNRVIESTGFSPYQPKNLNLNEKEQALAEKCMPYYLSLKKFAITASD